MEKEGGKSNEKEIFGPAYGAVYDVGAVAGHGLCGGKTLYVDAYNGNDDNTGTSDAPYKTIKRAVDAADIGDTIQIAAGTYDLSSGLTIEKAVSLQGVGEVTLSGNVMYKLSADSTGQSIFVTGLKFEKAGSSVQALRFRGVTAPAPELDLSISVSGCEFIDWDFGVTVNSHANRYNLIVSDTKFTNVKTGISVNMDNSTPGQLANNTLTLGSNVVFEGAEFAVETFNNQTGDSDDFKDFRYQSAEDFTTNTPYGLYVDGKYYYDVDTAIAAIQENSNVELSSDIQLNKRLAITKDGVTLDLNEKTITASNTFTAPNDVSKQLVSVDGATGVTIKNGSLVATGENKHTLNVYNATDLTLENLTLDHSAAAAGAPLVINNSSVEASGRLNLITGPESWYAVNLDPKSGNNVSFKLEQGGSITHTGTPKDLFVIDGISGYKKGTSDQITGKNATITFGAGTSVTPSAQNAPVVKQQEYKEGAGAATPVALNGNVVVNPGNAGLTFVTDPTTGTVIAVVTPVQPNRTPSYNKAPADWYNDKYDETEPDVILSENGIYLQGTTRPVEEEEPLPEDELEEVLVPEDELVLEDEGSVEMNPGTSDRTIVGALSVFALAAAGLALCGMKRKSR